MMGCMSFGVSNRSCRVSYTRSLLLLLLLLMLLLLLLLFLLLLLLLLLLVSQGTMICWWPGQHCRLIPTRGHGIRESG